MNRSLGLLGLLVTAAAPALAQAPTGSTMRLNFRDLEGTADSAFVAPAGGTFDARVRLQDNASVGLGAFTIRLYYDPARLTFVTARSSCPDSVGSPLQAPVTGPNYVELSAAGCATFNTSSHEVATATFQLPGGATEGGELHVEPRALTDRNLVDRTADGDGDFDEVCLAVGVWGDVDDDGQINSRDALIALSNAVGLPTPGYFVARGDVDADGYVGSRDALAMLSNSIGYPPAGGFRTGRGVATACTPQALLPRTVYYVRRGPSPGIAGISGLVVRAANDSAVTIVGDSADANPNVDYRPRVSPNGTQVLFICRWQFYFDVCRANADGTGLVNLTAGSFSSHASPDWSPAGDSIVFVRSSQIWVMNADGSGANVIPSSPTSAISVAWAPTAGSHRIAYINGGNVVRTRDLDSAGITDSLVFTGSPNQNIVRSVDWSPAGDSLVFSVYVNNVWSTYVAHRSNPGTPGRIARVPGSVYDTRPAWTDQGIFFTAYLGYPSPGRDRILLRRPNGSLVRLNRDVTPNFAAGMDRQ